jgi:DNA (cytosine-5)-methyltransferase 1
VLDLQHFGPPQRRVRLFVLAARTGGVDPAEVLALNEGVCGHPSPRQQSREIVAASIGGGVEGGCLTPWDSESKRVFTDAAVFPTLYAAQNSGQQQQSVMVLNISNGVPSLDDTMGTPDTDGASTTAIGNQTRGVVMAFHHTQDPISGDVSPAIGRTTDGMGVLSFEPRYYTRDNKTGGAPSDVVKVDASIGENGDAVPHVVCTTGDITHALTHEGADASEDGTGMVVGTLDCSDGIKWGSNQWVAQGKAMVTSGRPRRLTPKECERLMSWPDQWTQYGVKENGARYALSDTARYRLCGNGVASVQVQWIAERLIAAVAAQEDA